MKSTYKFSVLIIATIIFFGCSSMGEKKEDTNKEKLYGTYIGKNGAYQKISFGVDHAGQDDRVTLYNPDGTEMSTAYEIDKEELIIKIPNGKVYFQIVDKNTLKGENGDKGIYKKQ